MEKTVIDFLESRSEKAFKALYEQCNRSLYHVALAALNYQTSEAEDVVQEAWLTAIRKIDEFKGISTFKTWITGILLNLCRKKNEKQLRVHEIYKADTLKAGNDDLIDLEKALTTLPDGYREVLILHDLEGYKHREIAELMGISEGTSKSQLFNARKSIRKYFNEDEKGKQIF